MIYLKLYSIKNILKIVEKLLVKKLFISINKEIYYDGYLNII